MLPNDWIASAALMEGMRTAEYSSLCSVINSMPNIGGSSTRRTTCVHFRSDGSSVRTPLLFPSVSMVYQYIGKNCRTFHGSYRIKK